MTEVQTSPARLPVARLFGYSLGSFGTGVFSTVPTLLLLYFCTQILSIPAQYAALIVFAPKAWAIVWDPFVGVWSDRTRTRLGRRKPFLLAGTVGVLASFVGLFAWPYGEPEQSAWIVGGFYFALATTYSLFAVPFVAFPAEASDSPRERERVTAWRIGLAMVGTLIGAALAPTLVSLAGGGRQGYAVMSVVVAAICGAGMLSAFFSIPANPGGEPTSQRFSLRATLGTLAGARDLRWLLAAYLLALTGVGALSAITPYWVRFILGQPDGEVGVLMGCLFAATIVTTPLWALLVRRIGARPALAAAAVLYALFCCAMLAPGVANGGVATLGLFAAIGVAFSGLQVAPFALAAHLIHAQARRDGNDSAGLMTGLWTAGEKLGLALGPAAAGLGLALTGFVSGASAQSAQAKDGVHWLIALLPAVLAVASLVPLSRVSSPASAADGVEKLEA